jgi:hypothetical protein
MLRSTLIAAGVAVLCSASFAQQTLDASKVFPITSPVKNAGTFNVNTKRWMSPSKTPTQNGTIQVIYDNRCTWSGGNFYTGTGSCETYIDAGEIPGSANLAFAAAGGLGATDTNNVVLFQFAYCTNLAAVGSLRIGFYDTLGGACAGIVASNGGAPTGAGQPSLAAQACPASVTTGGLNPQGTAFYNVGLIGLPGDATPGGTAVNCWIISAFLGNTGFCIKSEGEGVWDNDVTLDRFNWSWDMEDASLPAGQAPNGILLRGEPATPPNPQVYGACTYNLQCDTDILSGALCGTGLGKADQFWINVDADPLSSTNNTGVQCISAPSGGSGCYWFGGYPGNPLAGFWMAMVADGACTGVVPTVNNCQILATVSNGCQSVASTVGLPSASTSTAFTVRFSSLNGNVNGVVFYGINGPVSVAWSPQSNLCVKSPTQRLNGIAGASGTTGGGVGTCNGQYSFNFNAVIQGSFPGLLGTPMAAGQRVDVQGWQRDAASTKTTNLTDALSFIVGP